MKRSLEEGRGFQEADLLPKPGREARAEVLGHWRRWLCQMSLFETAILPSGGARPLAAWLLQFLRLGHCKPGEEGQEQG